MLYFTLQRQHPGGAMTKQLIVVVHGVGVREAGASTDMLSTALEPAHPDDPLAETPDADDPRFIPESSDDFHLLEHPRQDSGTRARDFPARLRRFREAVPDNDHRNPRERVIADFYWGDVAALRGGAPGLVLGFFRVAMGLGHAIRENARAVFPEPFGPDQRMRQLAAAAVLTLHGPVIAINIVLLGGLLLHRALTYLAEDPHAAVTALVLAALAMAGGMVALRYTHAFLTRHMAGWLALTGAAVLLMQLVAPPPPDAAALGTLDLWLVTRSCAIFPDTTDCTDGYTGIYLIGLRLYAAMILALALAIGLAVAVGFGSWSRYRRGARPEHVVDLTVPALGLMILLWFLLISAIWGSVGYLGPDIIPEPEHVTSALRGLLPALVALIALAVIAGYVMWGKRALGQGFDPARYMDDPDTLAERHRLLICRRMLLVLFIFLGLLLAVGAHALTGFGGGWGRLSPDWLLARATPVLLGITATAGVVLVTTARPLFEAGLGILTDVLAWINDASWNSRALMKDPKTGAPVPHGPHTRTWIERALGWRKEPPAMHMPQGYWLRRRIRERMNLLMTQLIRDEAPDHIVLVSHSQGTVIALEVLASEGARWLEQLPEDGTIGLITMGAPYTHLYNRYFPESFPPPGQRPQWRPRGDSETAVLSRWVNIFRVDDFVGTHIDANRHHRAPADPGDRWPQEIPVPAGGHTNYWTDRTVAQHLRRELAPPTPALAAARAPV